MSDTFKIEEWDMTDFSVQASLMPDLFHECDVIQVNKEEQPVLAVLPWDTFLGLLKKVTVGE